MDEVGFGTARNSGRTQWMIDRLVEAVAEGQPYSRVVGRTMDYAIRILLPRVAIRAEAAGLEVRRCRQDTLEIGGCRVEFCSDEFVERKRLGTRGYREFWG